MNKLEKENEVIQKLELLKSESRKLINISDSKINEVLHTLANRTEELSEEIIQANRLDLTRMDPNNPKYDRLLLNRNRIFAIADDIRNVASLNSPLHKCLETRHLENGLSLEKVSVPLGIIGIIYESRPNVTFDVFCLCLKSGNACVLKGSSDAHYSNTYIVELINSVLEDMDFPRGVYLAPSEREMLSTILQAVGYIDTIIPRGGKGLIDYVRQNSKVPVIETGAGIVHTYMDKSADLQKAINIIKNAKTRRVSVCNALDTLLLHQDWLDELPKILEGLDQEFGLRVYADHVSFAALDGYYDTSLLYPADESSFGTEFLSMQMAIKTVDSLESALDHIYHHSSQHSEAIIAEDPKIIEEFLTRVDAAVVYANTSTAFTDGAQFGMGAEIGISTQKLHARGPMALNELTSYKWKVRGNGQIRP